MTENATRNPIASLASEAFAHEYARLLQDSEDVSHDLAWAESYLASTRAGLGDEPVAWSSEPVFVDGNGLERLETFSNIAYSVLDKALRASTSPLAMTAPPSSSTWRLPRRGASSTLTR